MDSILDGPLCPRPPCGHCNSILPRWEAFRHCTHNGSTPRSNASFASPLALAARRVSSLASPPPKTTRLRFALLGRQRSINMVSISIRPNRRGRWARSSRHTCAAFRSLDQNHRWLLGVDSYHVRRHAASSSLVGHNQLPVILAFWPRPPLR